MLHDASSIESITLKGISPLGETYARRLPVERISSIWVKARSALRPGQDESRQDRNGRVKRFAPWWVEKGSRTGQRIRNAWFSLLGMVGGWKLLRVEEITAPLVPLTNESGGTLAQREKRWTRATQSTVVRSLAKTTVLYVLTGSLVFTTRKSHNDCRLQAVSKLLNQPHY